MISYEEHDEHTAVICTATIEREGKPDYLVCCGALKGKFFAEDLRRARQSVFASIDFYLNEGGCEGAPMKGITKP